MLSDLAHPLPPRRALVLTISACLFVALYCLAYNALSGSGVTLREALGWSLSMIAPWLVAWETSKRLERAAPIALAIAAAFALSMVIGFVILDRPYDGFEVVRRLPALALLIGLIAASRWRVRKSEDIRVADLPLPASAITSVRAAGNYVELVGPDGVLTHRATLAATERRLAPHGFIRIHRSLLVRRDAIARIRGEDVVLQDGTHLPVGKRFRAALAA